MFSKQDLWPASSGAGSTASVVHMVGGVPPVWLNAGNICPPDIFRRTVSYIMPCSLLDREKGPTFSFGGVRGRLGYTLMIIPHLDFSRMG